ncbi:OmpA family protein [Hymenobacter arcticus]
MPQTPRFLFAALALAGGLSACGHKDQAAEQASPPTTAAAPAATETPTAETSPAPAAAPAAAFDVSTVPISTAALGPFPYVAGLKGFELNTTNSKDIDFERAYVYDGKTLLAIEGKVSRRLFDANRSDEKAPKVTELAIDRNYENQLKALGAVKVWTGLVPKEAVDKIGNDEYYKHHGFGTNDNDASDTYLIRQKDKEIWVQINSQSGGDYGIDVVEKAVMADLTTVLKADELKEKLAADGHVALHLNFDTDKATLRPDAQPVLAEVQKLLVQSPDLRLAVQGHTDNTSTPAHNQQLSEARARAVAAALTAQGIAADRLQAAGFGQSKPLADNATEAGRAQNRRVELVRR